MVFRNPGAYMLRTVAQPGQTYIQTWNRRMSNRTSTSFAPRFYARGLVAALAAALATAVQVLWASPDAPSAADFSASPLPYLPLLCLLSLLMTLAWLALLPRRLGVSARMRVVVLSLVAWWLVLNTHEFIVRVAAWSTFDTASIALHVLKISVLPIAACSAVLYLVLGRVLVERQMRTS